MKRAFVMLVSAVLLGLLLGPPAPSLGDHFLGIEYVDHYGTQWFYWFAGEALAGRTDAAHTDLLFHPWGKDILHHTGINVLDAGLAVPFLAVFGPVLGYNVFVLFGLALSAWAFYAFARRFSDDTIALGVGTLLFATSPFVLFELVEGRPTQAILALPILFLGRVLDTAERPGWKAPVLGGLLLALTGYQYWFYAFFCGIACLGYGLYRTWRPLDGSGGHAKTLARYALMAAVALVLASPVAISLVGAASAAEVPGLLDVDAWGFELTAPVTIEELNIGLFVWQPLRRYAGFYIYQDPGLELLLSQGVLLPVIWLPLFAVWAWRQTGVDRGGLLALLVPALVISMGPILVADQTVVTNPVYVLLAQSASFMQRLWWPARALVVPTILLGLSVTVLLGWLASRRVVQVVVAAVLAGVWAVELRAGELLPFPSWHGEIPAGYQCLATGPDGAIIELPFSYTQGHLYYQTAHGRPMLGGMLENNPVFAPDGFNTLREENSFVKKLYDISRMVETQAEVLEADKQAVWDLGYRYVVVQRDAWFVGGEGKTRVDNVLRSRERRLHHALADVMGRPVYNDARIDIYAPWGDPSPCADDPVEPSRKALGLTEVSADQRVKRGPTKQLLARPWQDLDELQSLLLTEGLPDGS